MEEEERTHEGRGEKRGRMCLRKNKKERRVRGGAGMSPLPNKKKRRKSEGGKLVCLRGKLHPAPPNKKKRRNSEGGEAGTFEGEASPCPPSK